MSSDRSVIERDYARSRLIFEIEELKKATSTLNLNFDVFRAIFRVRLNIKTIVYKNSYLINLNRGDIFDAFELASYSLNDDDLELSDEPLLMYINSNLDNTRRISAPLIKIASPDVCHPHVLQSFFCYGSEKIWKVNTTIASLMLHIINCLKMVPGSYLLSDALNPSAANYFRSQTKFSLPLT